MKKFMILAVAAASIVLMCWSCSSNLSPASVYSANNTPTYTATTNTTVNTGTATFTNTTTSTATNTSNTTATNTPTSTATNTSTSTSNTTATNTPTSTATNTATDTSNTTATNTATFTATSTATDTSNTTATNTVTSTATDTSTDTATPTATNTTTDTANTTATNTSTSTATETPTDTPTDTATATPTSTSICTPAIFGENATDSGALTPGNFTTVYYSNFSPAANGTLTDIQVYMNADSNCTVQAAVYTTSGGVPSALVGASTQQTVNTSGANQWVAFTISGNAALTSSTTYALCVAALSGTEPTFYTGSTETNLGTAALGGSDLTTAPTGGALAAGYLDIYSDYCQ